MVYGNLVEGGAESDAKNIPHEGVLPAPEPGRFWLALRLAIALTIALISDSRALALYGRGSPSI